MSNDNFLSEASMILYYGYGATPKINENAYDDRIAQDANEDDQFMNQIDTEPEDDEATVFLNKFQALAEEAKTLLEVKPDLVRTMGQNAKYVFQMAFYNLDPETIESEYSEFMNAGDIQANESTNSMDYLASRMLREPGMLQDEE